MTGPAADIDARPVARFAPATLRAAAWTVYSVVRTRRALKADGLSAERVAPPKGLPSGAGRGVLGVLRRLEPTCLERSIVLQTWLASHGRRFDVVVGVATEDGAVKAHAWLGYETPPPDAKGFREIHRIPPP